MVRKFFAPILLLSAAATAQIDDDLWDEAVVYRDEWGVPHIYAEGPLALGYAFGYAQAEDHLEAMLRAYRITNGRAAEVWGEAWAESDELAIKLAHADIAYDAFELSDWITRDLCNGFARGVNAWIIEHPDDTPEWAEGVHPADPIALMHRYQLSQAPFDYPEAFHLLPGTPSANAWAVAPSMSEDEKAMLVISPHADYRGEFQWYEAHLSTNDLNMYGATLFGLPVILQGHNESLGWALSPNRADIADLYVELPRPAPRRDPASVMPVVEDKGRSMFRENEWRNYFVRTEHGLEESGLRRRTTSHGPVVASAEGRQLAWKVGGYKNTGALRQFYDMGRAENLDDFRAAVDRQELSSFHVIYADKDGNIWYQYNAVTGTRKDVRDAADDDSMTRAGGLAHSVYENPLSTLDTTFEWRHTLEPHELPWFLNPESGYLQASGTPPWLVTTDTGTGPDDWPHWLVRDEDTYRAKRVRRLLANGPRSFRDMQAMLFDTVVPLATEAVPYLLSIVEDHPDWTKDEHPDLLVLLDMFREWDYLADTEATAMTLFHVWWSVLRYDDDGYLISDEALHALIQEDVDWFRGHLFDSATEAAQLVRNEYQTMDVPWGDVHVIRRGRAERPMPGASSGGPLFAGGDTTFEGGKWIADHGPGFAMVVRFDDTPEAVSFVPFGSSEDPASPHYDDQLRLLLERRYKFARFDREAVEAHARTATGKRLLLRARDYDATALIEAGRPVRARLAASAAWSKSMPPGTVAFTAFVEPVVQPERAEITIEMHLFVDEDVCAADNLDDLAVYAYHPVVGWRYVEEQMLNAARRTFTVYAYESQVFAVLGPASLRSRAPFPSQPTTRLARANEERPDAPSDAKDARPVAPAASRTNSLDKPSAIENGLLDADRERVANLFPPNPTLNDAEESSLARPSDAAPGWQLVTPAVPPGWRLQRDWIPPAPPAGAPPVRRPRTSAPARELPEEARIVPDTAAQPSAITPAPAAPSGPLRPAQNEPAAAESSQSVEAKSAPQPEKEHSVAWSDLTPRELLARRTTPSSSGINLAPDPALASPMLIGTNLELRPPAPGARFQVNAQRSVRAQAIIREAPPESYPTGLTAFSPVFEIMHVPVGIAATTAIVVSATRGLVKPERFSDLKLHVYDASFGWLPLPRQKINAEARTFTALDGGMRIYAVLGPVDALRTAND